MNPLDFWTRNAGRALNIFYLRDPIRTALGFVLGGAFSSLSVLFEPVLREFPYIAISAMQWWAWLPIGIAIMHIPTIVQLLKRPSVGSRALDTALQLIDSDKFSDAEKRHHYRRLVEHAVEAAVDEAFQKEERAPRPVEPAS